MQRPATVQAPQLMQRPATVQAPPQLAHICENVLMNVLIIPLVSFLICDSFLCCSVFVLVPVFDLDATTQA